MDNKCTQTIHDEYDEGKSSMLWRVTDSCSKWIKDGYGTHRKVIWTAVYFILIILYAVYFVAACWYDLEEAMVLLIITSIVLALCIYVVLRDKVGDNVYRGCFQPITTKLENKWHYIKWPLYITAVVLLIIVLVLLTKDHPKNLISAAGLLCLLIFTYIFSKNPRKVKWRPVIWGMTLQFILGLFILRTKVGFMIFDFLGEIVQTFLDYTDVGSQFIFGDAYTNHFFAFKVLPVVIYFSGVLSILYYLGIMQVVVAKIAWLMQYTMKTSASESLSAAGSIFIGLVEAPLLIRPFIVKMTKSELHAVMTSSLATIAGGVLGAYISFGISATHLLSASVMSAPAALAVSKLFYPETEQSQTVTEEQMILPKGEERNIIDAASVGASSAAMMVLDIAANLVAFLSLLALLNGLLGYAGGLVGFPQLSFELICSYVFMPLAFMMGADWKDCRLVAELIGTKTFLNEFVAYKRLSELIDNRESGVGPTMSVRSEVIATYALCGFANFGSIGILLGGLTTIAPQRKGDLASLAVRALIAGTVACLMTACIAGVLYIPSEDPYFNSNSTTPIAVISNTTAMLDAVT